MSEYYDFKTLSPEDFERLTRDLLSAEWKIQIESFKSGRDQGIDLKYATSDSNNKIIIQCKHYAPDAFARLKRKIQNDELPKVRKLSPERYLLVTSVPLSVANKDELLELLHPWCKSTSDILGANEINSLLISHPNILRAHFKLWLSSTEVLERVLHANIWNLSAATLEDLQREICRFVVHDGFQAALNILHDHHHCLIVGIPGIGKTTLAQILLWYYIQEGFTAVVVSQDISEAWAILTRAIQQHERVAVLYDDFLGQVNFESQKLEKNEDQRLIKMLDLVKRNSNIRFILTTREYILADAKRQYAALAQADISIEKFTLSLQRYTRANKARILFNHLYFSNLTSSRLSAIVRSEVYKTIIDHENYNPRIIRGICEYSTYSSLDDKAYIQKIAQQFDNPREVWDHAFCYDIRPESRALLYVLWSFGQETTLSALGVAFSALNQNNLALVPRESFDLAMKELDGNFIRTERLAILGDLKQEIIVRFHNPSIRDYLERKVRKEQNLLLWLVTSCIRFNQVEILFEMFERMNSSFNSIDRNKIAHALWSKGTELVESINETVIWFGGERKISCKNMEMTIRSELILSIAGIINDKVSAKQYIWPLINTKEKWAHLRSNAREIDSARLLHHVIEMGLLTEPEIKIAITTFYSHLIDVAEDAEWLTTLSGIADVFNQYPQFLNDLDKVWLADRTRDVARRVLKNTIDLTVDELEEERKSLQRSAAAFNFDDTYWDGEFISAISDAWQEKPDEDDMDERINTPRTDERIDIDGLFAELLNRD
jgi:hypothetical protein